MRCTPTILPIPFPLRPRSVDEKNGWCCLICDYEDVAEVNPSDSLAQSLKSGGVSKKVLCADIWSLLGCGKSSAVLRDDWRHSCTFVNLNSSHSSPAGESWRPAEPPTQPREQRPRQRLKPSHSSSSTLQLWKFFQPDQWAQLQFPGQDNVGGDQVAFC